MNRPKVLELLKIHRRAFLDAQPFAEETGHTTPSDTKSWSQILASYLIDTLGLARKKGSDLIDGSDVKAANTWGAIDTPRFNGVIKAGTKSETSGKLEYLDGLPYLIFVLWDYEPNNHKERCRVWIVRTQKDKLFRDICSLWYNQPNKSNNFQLHPPRGKNSNIFTNNCGNLEYPLLFEAIWDANSDQYEIVYYDESAIKTGVCKTVNKEPKTKIKPIGQIPHSSSSSSPS